MPTGDVCRLVPLQLIVAKPGKRTGLSGMLSVAPRKIPLNPAAPVVVCRLIRAVYGEFADAAEMRLDGVQPGRVRWRPHRFDIV